MRRLRAHRCWVKKRGQDRLRPGVEAWRQWEVERMGEISVLGGSDTAFSAVGRGGGLVASIQAGDT